MCNWKNYLAYIFNLENGKKKKKRPILKHQIILQEGIRFLCFYKGNHKIKYVSYKGNKLYLVMYLLLCKGTE